MIVGQKTDLEICELRGINQSSSLSYQGTCTICYDFESSWLESGNDARIAVLIHAAQQHGRVLAEHWPVEPTDSKDKDQQQLIRLAQRFDLPLPGYDEHENGCVRQYITQSDGEIRVICTLHQGFSAKNKYWLGYY